MEHINTFSKGMTSDFNVMLQPDGTYRYMKNCSLISQDGNNYVIKDCLGNVKLFSINIPYSGAYPTLGTPPTPIAFISFPDTLIVYSTSNESSGGAGAIGMIRYLPYGQGIQPSSVSGEMNAGYVPLYFHNDLAFSKAFQITGFGLTESSTNKKVYWTDNNNEPRLINIGNPILTNYLSSGSLEIGKKYMVIEGAIRHPIGVTTYAPGLGNVFTASANSYQNLSGSSPSPKVIEYFPIELLDWTPDASFGNIKFVEYGAGSLYCGSKVYYYRLTTADGSYTTPWSHGSYPVHVGRSNNYSTGIDYHDFVGAGTTTLTVNSSRSVKINIEGIDTIFSYIEVACAEYDNLPNVARLISIITRQEITGSSMEIEHEGGLNLETLTVEQINNAPASIRKIKTLGTNKNYILTGNITEREEFEWSNDGVSITSFEYPMPARKAINCTNGVVSYSEVHASMVSGFPSTLPRWSSYVVRDGSVSWNATTYAAGDIIRTQSTSAACTIVSGGPTLYPIVTKNRYTKIIGGTRTEDYIEITGDEDVGFWDYREPTVHHHVAGYWSRETYRFGIMFYDLKGKPFYVRHLGDYTMPTQYTKGGISFDAGTVWHLNPSLVKINGLFIPTSIINQISGFSIVRAERTNPRIITQGIVAQCTNGTAFRPASYIQVSKDADIIADTKYIYICPDQLAGYPFKTPIGQPGDSMEEACWLDISVSLRANGNSDFIITNLLTNPVTDNQPRSGTITFWEEVNEAEEVTNDYGTFHNKDFTLDNGVAAAVVCPGGAAGSDLSGYQAVGGKKVWFGLEEDFRQYSVSDNYTSIATNSYTTKILMNYVNEGGGTYGEAGDSQTYISVGHFQPINATVIAHTGTIVGGVSGCQFNGIEIGGGDCFTCYADYGYGLFKNGYGTGSYSYAWFFPCECNSNYNLRRGRKVSTVGMYYSGDPTGNKLVYISPDATPITNLEDYQYNPGYSSEGQAIQFPGLPTNFSSSSTFGSRVRYAGPKSLGEIVDSFRTFATNDRHDLDAQQGQINHLAIKDGWVLVWQDNMTSTVPVLQRQILSGVAGAATSLGTGGVVDRHDPITSYFGTQHQHSVIPTEYGFAWFDMRRKAFMVFDGRTGEMSHGLGMGGFFNEAFFEQTIVNDSYPLINPSTLDPRCDRPLMGTGICGVYDPKLKTTYMSFKFELNTSVGQFNEYVSFVAQDFTIGYDHIGKRFIGFFDWFPCIAHCHNQIVLSVNRPRNLNKYYGPLMSSTQFTVGEVFQIETSEYIMTGTNTVASYTTTPPVNSVKINTVNEIWVSNQPSTHTATTSPDYLYNSFFGRAVNNELWIVVNPKTRNQFNVQCIEQVTPADVNYTEVIATAGDQTAADSDIDSTNLDYRFIDNVGICSSVPLSETGRIVNKYLLLKFKKKNWTGSAPQTVSASVKILQAIISKFVEKR